MKTTSASITFKLAPIALAALAALTLLFAGCANVGTAGRLRPLTGNIVLMDTEDAPGGFRLKQIISAGETASIDVTLPSGGASSISMRVRAYAGSVNTSGSNLTYATSGSPVTSWFDTGTGLFAGDGTYTFNANAAKRITFKLNGTPFNEDPDLGAVYVTFLGREVVSGKTYGLAHIVILDDPLTRSERREAAKRRKR